MATPFEDFVAAFDPPVVIVTAAAGSLRGGCLVGFHSKVSIDPARYSVRLSKANHTYRVALFATHLAVHAPDRSDRDLAELFGGTTGDERDKLAACTWDAGPGGVPLLARCPNRLVLRTVSIVDDGSDHVAFTGEIADAAAAGGLVPLRLSEARSIDAGHPAAQRPVPDDVSARATPASGATLDDRGNPG
ncbi:MAG: flavin reductase family protein [Ilumatobacteraceae bacterium]